MGFPIVIGSKSVSSRAVAQPEPVEEFSSNDDETLLHPSVPTRSTVFACHDDHGLWQAVLTLSYYDMVKPDATTDNTTAELRVQISPLAACSSTMTDYSYRDSLYRIPLPCTSTAAVRRSNDPTMNGNDRQLLMLEPQAVFSSDRRFLTVLIPHHRPPADYCNKNDDCHSTVVVFQLRRPAKACERKQPPLPVYIQTAAAAAAATPTSGPTVVPVATNPRILTKTSRPVIGNCSPITEPLLNVTCLCDVATTTGKNQTTPPSLLILGCRDGSLHAVSYRPLTLAPGQLYQRINNDDETIERGIVAMDHLTEWHNANDGTIGRLAVAFQDGTVSVFRSHLVIANTTTEQQDGFENGEQHTRTRTRTRTTTVRNKGTLHINLTPTHEIDTIDDDKLAYFTTPRWIAGSYLALAQRPDDATTTIAVFGLYDKGRAAPVSTLRLTRHSLEEQEESAHTTFLVDDSSSFSQSPTVNGVTKSQTRIASTGHDSLISLDYDAGSDCLAVSAYLLQSRDNNHDDNKRLHFLCVWNWRTNAQGFTAVAKQQVDDNDNNTTASSSSLCLSKLCFARDDQNRTKLVHLLACSSATSNHNHLSPQRLRIRKEVYDYAVLSPPPDRSQRGGRIRPSCSLLLSSSTVSYPHTTTKSSTRDNNFELQWTESIIPKSYLASYGAPTVAAIGDSLGRSIAVASARGLCVLDCASGEKKNRLFQQPGRSISSRSHDDTGATISDRGKGDDDDAAFAKLLARATTSTGHAHSRWHVFGNQVEERAFRVVTMSWWEAAPAPQDGTVLDTGDLLVAVIQVVEGRKDSGYYLSCWSSKDLGVRGQLLRFASVQENGKKPKATWGIRLREGFCPEYMDLLPCPLGDDPQHKACVLLAGADYSSSYQIFQLQAVALHSSLAGVTEYKVFSRRSASGAIGSPAELFLAGATFAFDLEHVRQSSAHSLTEDANVATMGVIRRYGGGVDACAVSLSDVVAVGQVIQSADAGVGHPRESEISRYWLADVVRDRFIDESSRLDFYVWVLQLANGRLLSWFVPFVTTPEQTHYVTEPSIGLVGSGFTLGSRAVHPKGFSLGFVCSAGTTSNWMQHSEQGTRNDFLVGSVPRSCFGCTIGVGQNCKRLHRSLGDDFDGGLFRADFLDHEIFGPSDFVLYPPTCLPALYSLVLDSESTRLYFHRRLGHFSKHINQRMSQNTLRNTTAMALQLVVLRCVEKIAASSKSNQSDAKADIAVIQDMMFAALVEAARRNTTPLQFATLFLKIGRQVEPSCFCHLFPLPSPSNTGTESQETVDELFHSSLSLGSINMSVAALPLLEGGETTKATSAAIFHYCVSALDAAFDNLQPPYFDVPEEETDATGDIFRYAMKLSDHPVNHDDDSHSNDSDDDDDRVPERSYSIICGLSSFFSRASTKPPTEKSEETKAFLVNGIPDSRIVGLRRNGLRNIKKLLSWQESGDESFETVAGVAARYVLSTLFDDSAFSKQYYSWRKVGALANLLVGDTRTGFHFCSRSDFAELDQSTNANSYRAILPPEIRRSGGVVTFIKRGIDGCALELGPIHAASLFDLVLILLGSASRDVQPELPGLLLVAIVSGHTADRIDDILPDDPTVESTLWTAYIQVKAAQQVNGV